jgi:hypothetical protein
MAWLRVAVDDSAAAVKRQVGLPGTSPGAMGAPPRAFMGVLKMRRQAQPEDQTRTLPSAEALTTSAWPATWLYLRAWRGGRCVCVWWWW